MSPELSCPSCGQPVEATARRCEHCHAVLALAAVVAEKETISASRLPEGMPLAPEVLVPRLGEYLVQNGQLTPDQLAQALQHQAKSSSQGTPVLLGQALRELGLISPEALDQAVTVQILQLQNALRRSNRDLEQRVRERTAELEHAIEKLGELNQLKANFIANISHELRTPLTHLKGYLEIFAAGDLGALTDQQSDVLQILMRSESRLERLIEDLIQFSLVSRGSIELALTSNSVEKMLSQAISQVENRARGKNVNLQIRVPHKLPAVQCDEEKITWVIMQLLDNAIKFTPNGGKIQIGVSKEQSFVKISVADTGIGIEEDRLSEIFEPFHQLDGSSTRRFGGTGLGLALSSQIIAAHQSGIQVQSVVGKGSRFEFRLAVSKQPVVTTRV